MELRTKLAYILKDMNSWWKGRFALETYFKRNVFDEIERFIKLPQIIALVGLRRTGKTTLIFKIIEQFLNLIPPGNILYFSFDDFANLELEDLIAAYEEIFSRIDLRSEKFLFCFDEIQKLENWQEKIKRLYDSHKNIKIILSGSESLFIRKGIKESLGGRIFEFRVAQLSFAEYLRFVGKAKFIKNPVLYSAELLKLYRRYMKTNGFPEIAGIDDAFIIHKYLKETVVDKILFKDIPQLFRVKNTGILGELLDIISFSPGQIIDITKLAKEISLSRQAVSTYLDYLEKAFLIKKIYNFSSNLRKQKRSLKKYYPAVIFPEVIEENFALSFEASFIWQLNVSFFWRDVYKNEIDIILADSRRKITPVEIKTGAVELKAMNNFLSKHNLDKGIIITIDKNQTMGKIQLIPYYKYLLEKEG